MPALHVEKASARTAESDRLPSRLDARYLLHLIACGLRGKVPQDLPGGASWESVHALAVKSSVEGAAWAGARRLVDAGCGSLPVDLATRWAAEADAELWRRVQFDVEREAVLAAMDAAGLAHLPLKGLVIAPLYPEPTMRSMCDNDILYGYVESEPDGGFGVRGANPGERDRTAVAATRDLAEAMGRLGYRAEHLGSGNADCFYKEPCLNFEMHRVLTEPSLPWADYYANPWKWAIPDMEKLPGGCGKELQGSVAADTAASSPSKRAGALRSQTLAFHFSHEDTYLYHMVHTAKHFDNSGCGIRCLVDERVLLDAWGNELDWGYLDHELSVLGLTDFERDLREFADAALGIDAERGLLELTEGQGRMLRYLLGSGTYGNSATRMSNKLARFSGGDPSRMAHAKRAYLLERIFPPRAVMESYHPQVHRYPWLLPFAHLYRWVTRLAVNSRAIFEEIGAVLRKR